MDDANLALVFSTNFLRPREDTIESTLGVNKLARSVRTMIEFPEDVLDKKKTGLKDFQIRDPKPIPQEHNDIEESDASETLEKDEVIGLYNAMRANPTNSHIDDNYKTVQFSSNTQERREYSNNINNLTMSSNIVKARKIQRASLRPSTNTPHSAEKPKEKKERQTRPKTNVSIIRRSPIKKDESQSRAEPPTLNSMRSYSGDYTEHYMQLSVRDQKKLSFKTKSNIRRSAEYPSLRDLAIDPEDHTTDEEVFKMSTSSDETIDVAPLGTLTSPDFYDSFEEASEDEHSYRRNKVINKRTHISSHPETKKKQNQSSTLTDNDVVKVQKSKKTRRSITVNKRK
eukprot:TRINITY_DN2247_c0_g3_i2.p1 TRINITY_DN2247_c0_g3~~TRINITY_DN2247_c0_g3_i2.p1  ORF type:complete len:342 (-),score=53.15 TRINITY_DN2247_c0_g3_i2:172-1197(-)